ncbi:MAG: MoxR family ATPase [Spirochaetales bacterium]|jgi:MoxR-like ATPase|nr:MoxR family ATPase [Spirochaetales bacterium]
MANEVPQAIGLLINNIKRIISVDTQKLEYIIAAKVAGGHVILADSHGVGKTSLARALAGSIRWHSEDLYSEGVKLERFNRIQCTVDLLPQDILGYNRFIDKGEIVFNKGPIFAHFVLCDEINLLTPKTQGSFLQVMEEQSVTIEGKVYHLPDPFFIIATMNLKGVHLFPLPAPQLDRFMIRLSLGYPSQEEEEAIVKRHGRADAWTDFEPVIDSLDLIKWKKMVDEVQLHPDITSYIVTCVRKTRSHPDIESGASPRAGVRISRLVRALSLCRGLDYVPIDFVKETFIPAMAHSIITRDPSIAPEAVLQDVLDTVPVETKRA